MLSYLGMRPLWLRRAARMLSVALAIIGVAAADAANHVGQRLSCFDRGCAPLRPCCLERLPRRPLGDLLSAIDRRRPYLGAGAAPRRARARGNEPPANRRAGPVCSRRLGG